MGAIFTHAAWMWQEMKAEFDSALDAHSLRAEHETNGNLLNRAGRAKGIRSASLFSGSVDRAHRYASEELLDFWTRHPRPSLADYEDQWAANRLPTQ